MLKNSYNLKKTLVQIYELKNPFSEKNISCYLEIINNKEYCIYFIVGSDDDRLILFLSFGSMSVKESSVLLTDIRSNSILILGKRNKIDLFVKKGFELMYGKYFIYVGESDSFTHKSILDIKGEPEKRKKKVEEYLSLINSDRIPLQLGVYDNEYVYLDINVDFNFKIYYLIERTPFLLSEGKWIKEGNKLQLYDSYLDYYFLLLIDSRSLISIYFPNEINESDQYSLVKNGLYPFIMR